MARKKITSVVIEQSRANLFVVVNRLDGRNMSTCNIYHAAKKNGLRCVQHWRDRGFKLLTASLDRNLGLEV